MSLAKKGEGVHQSYKDEAQKGFDVLFRVKIRGRSMLTDGIPLHMSIKIFKDPKEFKISELEQFAQEHNVVSPDPKKLSFKPIIFESERTGDKFFMLEVTGLGPQYKALYDEYDDVGNVYKRFFTHITIDKAIYEDIKEHPLKPDEIEFSRLILEAGANNTMHEFKKSESAAEKETIRIRENKKSPEAQRRHEFKNAKWTHPNGHPRCIICGQEERIGGMCEPQPLEKGIKHVAAGFAIAGAMAAPHQANAPAAPAPKAGVHQQSSYDSGKMLRTIASVETSSGHNLAHKPVGGIHGGESAFGKYGLMPNTIRETIGMNRDLKHKYGNALKLKGDDMRRYMEDNPGLEDTIAQRHLQRLEHHFGKDPAKLGYAWLEGIRGTYKADKDNKNINDHWHVRKIKDAYAKEK